MAVAVVSSGAALVKPRWQRITSLLACDAGQAGPSWRLQGHLQGGPDTQACLLGR